MEHGKSPTTSPGHGSKGLQQEPDTRGSGKGALVVNWVLGPISPSESRKAPLGPVLSKCRKFEANFRYTNFFFLPLSPFSNGLTTKRLNMQTTFPEIWLTDACQLTLYAYTACNHHAHAPTHEHARIHTITCTYTRARTQSAQTEQQSSWLSADLPD